MRKIFITLLSFFALAFTMHAAEISEKTRAVLTKIEEANKTVKTISSDLNQTKTMVNGRQFKSTGNFYYASPDELAIIYTDKLGDYLIVNTTQLAQKKGKKEQKFSIAKNDVIKNLSSTLLCCISGRIVELAEANDATVTTTETGGKIKVTLTPGKRTTKGFEKIELYYDKTSMYISSMVMQENNGAVTEYVMVNPKFNQSLDQTVFEIK